MERRSTRTADLAAQIRRLTEMRDAQSPDTLYSATWQAEIDAASVELAAWRLAPDRMTAAETAIRDADQRLAEAHTGRSRWPVVAGASGASGVLYTAGYLLAGADGLPLPGGVLLATAALALGLTVRARTRDAADAESATNDLATAEERYAALVADHAHAIHPYRAALPAPDQEAPQCSPQLATAPATITTPSPDPAPAPTSGAVTAGRPPIGSATSPPSSSATASAA